jgi:hypothetical protein
VFCDKERQQIFSQAKFVRFVTQSVRTRSFEGEMIVGARLLVTFFACLLIGPVLYSILFSMVTDVVELCQFWTARVARTRG